MLVLIDNCEQAIKDLLAAPVRSEGFCGLGIVSEEALIPGTNRLRTIAFMVPFGAAALRLTFCLSPIAADGCHGSPLNNLRTASAIEAIGLGSNTFTQGNRASRRLSGCLKRRRRLPVAASACGQASRPFSVARFETIPFSMSPF